MAANDEVIGASLVVAGQKREARLRVICPGTTETSRGRGLTVASRHANRTTVL